MKTIILMLCIALYAINVFAQEFGTLNAEWIYNYNGFWSQGVTIVKFEKDTILYGVPTQCYAIKAIRTKLHPTDSTNFDLSPIYIRAKDGIILISEGGEVFDTLINYKAEIGRSWNMHKRYRHINDIRYSMKITVLDTLRTNFSGVEVFTMVAKYEYIWPKFIDYIDTIYEYMGSRFHYILPFDELEVAVDGGEGGELKCFRNDTLGLVSFKNLRFGGNFPYDCNIINASDLKPMQHDKLPISWKYFNSVLQIENLSGITYHFNLVDVFNRQMVIGTIHSGLNTLNIPDLPKGIYYLIVNKNCLGKLIY